MPRLYIFTLCYAVLLLAACKPAANKPAPISDSYKDLITIAKNESKPLAERYVAAQKATALSFNQQNLAAQIECKRLTGMFLLMMDSMSSALTDCRTLELLARKAGDKESEGIACNNMALIKNEQSEYDSAIYFYERADKLYSSIGDSIRQVQSKINAGIVYKNIGSFEKAFSISIDAARIMKNLNANDELASAYTTLGNTLKDLHRTEEALSYHTEALAIRQKLGDSTGIAGSFNNIGNVYKGARQYRKALDYYLRAMELKKRHGTPRSRATTFDNLAETMAGLNDYKQAADFAAQAIALRDKEKDKDGWMTTAGRLAAILLARNETDSAIQLALQIEKIADAPIYLKQQLNNALLLKDLYTKKNNLTEALRYSQKALVLKDSLFSADMSAAISNMNVRYRTEEQRRQIEQGEKINQLKSEQIKRQTYFILLLAAGLLLLLIIVYLLRASNIQRKKAREKTELLMSELNHRIKNNIQLITGILNLQISESSDTAVSSAITAAKNRIESIGILHKLLYQKEYTGTIDMDSFINSIAQNIHYTSGDNRSQSGYSVLPSAISLPTDEAVLTGLITNEILTNIYKYAKPSQGLLQVELRLQYNRGYYELSISDNGQEWTAPPPGEKSTGLGLQLIDMLAAQMKATVQYKRAGLKNYCLLKFAKN